jgi:hypothetical protein
MFKVPYCKTRYNIHEIDCVEIKVPCAIYNLPQGVTFIIYFEPFVVGNCRMLIVFHESVIAINKILKFEFMATWRWNVTSDVQN